MSNLKRQLFFDIKKCIHEHPSLVLYAYFIIFEADIRHLANSMNENKTLHDCIIQICKNYSLSEEIKDKLIRFKDLRNYVIHQSNNYSGLEINGKFFPFDEPDTCQYILETYVDEIFDILDGIEG